VSPAPGSPVDSPRRPDRETAGARLDDVGTGGDAQAWALVVPVKHLHLAKSRLDRAFSPAARADLALAFAVDVVSTALAVPLVTAVLVVTDDERAAEELVAVGAHVVHDQPDDGLNPALTHGATLLRRDDARCGVAALSADLPALRADDLAAALAAATGRGFVADATGTGTTLLAAAAGHELLPAYGARSRDRHLASGAVELPGAPGLRRDVDTPEDLAEALRLGVGPRTAAALAALA
jgi:2-phospho-L-lactate guanylyltransferase